MDEIKIDLNDLKLMIAELFIENYRIGKLLSIEKKRNAENKASENKEINNGN